MLRHCLEEDETGEFVESETISDSIPQLGKDLTGDKRSEFSGILQKFPDVMSGHGGRTDVVQHHINISSGQPVRQPPYRLPHACKETVEKQLKEMLEGVIEQSQSEWAG